MQRFQDFSIHNHTTFSDGKNSVAEVITAAKQAGLKTIGISDHYWQIQDIPSYVQTIRAEQERQQFPVLLGMEVDYPAPHQWEQFYKMKRDFGFDYFIGSLHVVPYDGDWHYVGNKEKRDIVQTPLYQKTYWETLPNLACDLFDIVAHMDLIKITGITTEPQFGQEIEMALKAFKANNQIVEINTKYHKPESFPSDTILAKVVRANLPVIFSTDSHAAEHLMYRFESEQQRLHKLFNNLNHISQTGDLLRFLQTRQSTSIR